MIKKYHQITISDYNLIEREGIITHLKMWYNIFPLKWFTKQIKKEFDTLVKKINGSLKSEDEESERLLWQIESLQKINHLNNAYGAIYNWFLQSEANEVVMFYRKTFNRFIKISTNKNIAKYIEKIKKLSGIEIKTGKDLNRLLKEIEFRKDKYNENYMSEEHESTEAKKHYLMGYVIGVYAKLNMSFNPDTLTVVNFLSARDEALKTPAKKD